MGWGTSVEADRALRFYRAESDIGVPVVGNAVEPLHAYSKDRDDLMLGAAQLSSIGYYFWRGRFYGMSAATGSLRTKDSLKGVCFERFGLPDRTENLVMPGVRYTWAGATTTVFLEDCVWYWRITMVSTELASAREAYRRPPAAPAGPADSSRGF